MNKAIIDCVKEWLSTCEYLSNYTIRTDYLTPNANDNNSLSLEQEKTPDSLTNGNILKTMLKGSLNFTLASRCFFDVIDDNPNNENLLLLQKIESWIAEQNIKRNYPTLNDNEEVTGLTITNSPFLFGFDKSMSISRYQLGFNLTFERWLNDE